MRKIPVAVAVTRAEENCATVSRFPLRSETRRIVAASRRKKSWRKPETELSSAERLSRRFQRID